MNIRESMEQRERELLSPYAALSGDSRGRGRPEEECDVRTVYQRDREPDPALQGFPQDEGQDTGFSCTAGRSLQEPAYPYSGGIADRTYHCKGIAAE